MLRGRRPGIASPRRHSCRTLRPLPPHVPQRHGRVPSRRQRWRRSGRGVRTSGQRLGEFQLCANPARRHHRLWSGGVQTAAHVVVFRFVGYRLGHRRLGWCSSASRCVQSSGFGWLLREAAGVAHRCGQRRRAAAGGPRDPCRRVGRVLSGVCRQARRPGAAAPELRVLQEHGCGPQGRCGLGQRAGTREVGKWKHPLVSRASDLECTCVIAQLRASCILQSTHL
mmetsp:Transcript_115921/g.368613  ORF Transcript_115921/g.368613 Transcript_115921/m.368613 type:complete len:225 (+) Transcript_115921:369-1043(+)